jgi:hypothetical protein
LKASCAFTVSSVHEAAVHELVRGLQYEGVLPGRKAEDVPAGEQATDRLAVIAPYRAQVQALKNSLAYRAVLALTRHAAWWLPKWLERRLPDLDMEGGRLDHAHGAAVPKSAPAPRTGPDDAESARASDTPSTAD